jgi:hypothetical protein
MVSKGQRSALMTSLSDPMVYTNGIRTVLQTQVYSSLPKMGKDAALIIHRRVYIDANHPQKEAVSNFCFECTVFLDGGVRRNEYDYALFSFSSIAEHITKSKRSLVMSLLSPTSGFRNLPTLPNETEPSQTQTQDSETLDSDNESMNTRGTKTDEDTKTDQEHQIALFEQESDDDSSLPSKVP